MSHPGIRPILGLLVCFACAKGPHQPTDPPPHNGPTRAISVTDPAFASTATETPPAPGSTASNVHSGDSESDANPPSSAAAPPKPDQPLTAVEPVPELRDRAGKPLPQTEALPTFDSPSFKRRIELLFEAIVRDEPERAAPAFFPLLAYEQVKDVSQPERDWKHRLMAAFAKNIHDYHRRLGKTRDQSKLVGVVPPTVAPRWMKPGTEGNRVGYHRLLRTKLEIAEASGNHRSLEVTSMISWRGEWYIVHLNGFK